jgi:hypothetical protein
MSARATAVPGPVGTVRENGVGEHVQFGRHPKMTADPAPWPDMGMRVDQPGHQRLPFPSIIFGAAGAASDLPILAIRPFD